jgi:hypothetical protein
MVQWTADERNRIGRAEELQVASQRSDGSLRPYVTIWAVCAGEEIYIRSAYGPENGWFRRATASGTGRIRAGGVERDVTFADADPAEREAIDTAYHAKYDRYGARIVGSVTGPNMLNTTTRLVPRASDA